MATGKGLVSPQKRTLKRVTLFAVISLAVATAIQNRDEIIKTAKSFVGQEETANNSGFKDKTFQAAMTNVGWRSGYSWCVFFTKLVWQKSLKNDTIRALAMKLISGNSQVTLANFTKDKSGKFIVSDTATVGAIVIYQEFTNGVGTSSGHAGIVTAVFPDYFETIEGNTNNNGGREGYIVAAKKRKFTARAVTNGLRLRKFITIRYAK